MDVTLFKTCSHVIIMRRKVDPRPEGGTRILIKERSIKVIETCQVLEKARLMHRQLKNKRFLLPKMLQMCDSQKNMENYFRKQKKNNAAHFQALTPFLLLLFPSTSFR